MTFSAEFAVDRREELGSGLLAQLFGTVEHSERVTVLDVGPGSAAAVRFLTGFRCHVVFADLFDDLGDREVDIANVRRFFSDAGGIRFDICLLWDFLNYLSADELREFGQLLRQHLHGRSRGHAFGAFTALTDFTGLRFELRNAGRMGIISRRGPTPYRHTNRAIGRVLWPLTVSRAVLLDNNRQELLFAAAGDA